MGWGWTSSGDTGRGIERLLVHCIPVRTAARFSPSLRFRLTVMDSVSSPSLRRNTEDSTHYSETAEG